MEEFRAVLDDIVEIHGPVAEPDQGRRVSSDVIRRMEREAVYRSGP